MSDYYDNLTSELENEEMEQEIIVIEGDIDSSDSDSDSDSYTSYNSHLSRRDRYIPEPNSELERIQENVERIYNLETEFLDSEKENHKYYLGICTGLRGQRILLNIAIQPKTFLKFDIQSVLNYLAEYSIFTIRRQLLDVTNVQLQIMKLNMEPRPSWQTVILKTYWIRIIQRTGKRIFRERPEMLLKRRTLQNMRYFEIHGKHLPGIHVLPTLYGMLL